MKRIGGLLLAILGVGLAVFGIVRGATSEDSTVVEVTIPGGEAQMMYTAPGVLHLVDDTVDVTLSAPEGEIHWAVGSTQDVEDFIGDASAIKVTGLSDWETPSYEEIPGTPEGIEAVATAGAEDSWRISHMDLWLESGTGSGSVEFSLEPDQSVQQSLIVSTTAGAAPDMTLAWDRALITSNPTPFVVIGILVALIGTLLLISSRQDATVNKKREVKRRERNERQEAETSVIPKISDTRDETTRATGGVLGAGIMPGANEELRDRELRGEDRLVLPAPDADSTDSRGDAEDGSARDSESISEQTDGAFGAGILPGANAEIRERELADSDRLTVASAEPEPDQKDHSETNETQSNDVVSAKAPDEDGEKDWRSLWNFSWGTPWTKGDDNED